MPNGRGEPGTRCERTFGKDGITFPTDAYTCYLRSPAPKIIQKSVDPRRLETNKLSQSIASRAAVLNPGAILPLPNSPRDTERYLEAFLVVTTWMDAADI